MFTLFRPELGEYAQQVIAEHRRYYAGDIPAPELQSLQTERIRATLRYVRQNSPFYRRLLRDHSAEALAGVTTESLQELPFTTKDDLRAELFDVPSQPLDKAWTFYETTGTTGRATPCPRDERDSIVNNTALTLSYEAIFRQHGDRHVVAVLGPTELHSTGDTFGDVLRNLGHTVVKMWPHSPVVGIPRALTLLAELGVTAVVCTPGMAITLAKELRRSGADPKSAFQIRLMLALGELAAPAMLQQLGQLWGCAVYNCMYASQESSILASCRADGLLHTVPLNNFYEVVDDLGRRVAPGPGAVREGELVISHLYQGAKPLVRYRTGDMVRLAPSADSTTSQVLRPIGRVRDALHLAGRPVCAFDIEETLFLHIRGVIDYRLVIEQREGADVVVVHLEPVDEAAGEQIDRVEIAAAVRAEFGVDCEIELGRMDAITSTGAMVSWKAARIHDRRDGEIEPERLAALAIASARSSA